MGWVSCLYAAGCQDANKPRLLGVWTSAVSLSVLVSVRRVPGTLGCSVARSARVLFQQRPWRTANGNRMSFTLPGSLLASFPFFSGIHQSTDQGLGEESIHLHGVLKSGCACLGILTEILFWLCCFCVKCLQKQSVVRIVKKETWEKRLDLPRGGEEERAGRRRTRGRRSGWASSRGDSGTVL